MGLANLCFAANEKRIEELKALQAQINKEVQQYQQNIQQKQIEFVKLQGAIEELGVKIATLEYPQEK